MFSKNISVRTKRIRSEVLGGYRGWGIGCGAGDRQARDEFDELGPIAGSSGIVDVAKPIAIGESEAHSAGSPPLPENQRVISNQGFLGLFDGFFID